MTKRRLASYGLNLVGVVLLYAAITLAFTFNAFGKSTTYIQGICTTACYTIIMVTSLNLVVGFMGEFSMGHAGFVSVGAYVSAIVSGALAGHGLSDLALLLVAILAGGLARALWALQSASRHCGCGATTWLSLRWLLRDYPRLFLQLFHYGRRQDDERYSQAFHV